jgi:ABC-2 type transport system permease protein
MKIHLSKWWITIKISWVKHTAYRLNFLLQILGPAIVFLFVKYNLWNAIYEGDPGLVIKGFPFNQMIQYHFWAFIVGLVAQGHGAWNLAEDIRMGRISSYLIYPFNFWEFHTASWLSFQAIQIFITSLTLILFSFAGVIQLPELTLFIFGIFYTLFISCFWFCIQYFTGLLAFWLEETWILRVSLSIISTFLSGAIIPLDLYPEAFTRLLDYTPFPYLSYYPIQIFMGKITDPMQLSMGITIIGIWTIGLSFLNHKVWSKGIKLYTAAGM